MNGKYQFDPNQIGEAHADCFRRFLHTCAWGDINRLVIDNTNTTVAEIAPYMLAAAAFGHNACVYTLDCDPWLAHQRNIHGVYWDAQLELYPNRARKHLPLGG